MHKRYLYPQCQKFSNFNYLANFHSINQKKLTTPFKLINNTQAIRKIISLLKCHFKNKKSIWMINVHKKIMLVWKIVENLNEWKWLSQHPMFYYFQHRRIIEYMKRNQHEEFVTRIYLKHAHILIVGMLLLNGIWHIGSLLANRSKLKSSPTLIIFVLVNDKMIPMVLILSKHAQMIHCV